MRFSCKHAMTSAAIETGVDDLIRFLKTKGKIGLKEAAQAINVSEQTLQLWVDFLVEERILGMEYKFTKPFIFLNAELQKKESSSASDKKADALSITHYKKEFVDEAKKKKLPESTITQLWRKKVTETIDKKKDLFIREANKRGLPRTEELFKRYKQKQLAQ